MKPVKRVCKTASLFSLSSKLSNALLRLIAQHSQVEPTIEPILEPNMEPTVKPIEEPTVKQTIEPTDEPLSTIRGNCHTLVNHDTRAELTAVAEMTMTVMLADCGGSSNSNSDSGGSDGNSDGSIGGDGNGDTDGDSSGNDCSGDGDSNGSSGGKSDSDGGDGDNDCRAHGNNLYEYRGQVQIYGIEDTYIQSTYIQITHIVFGDHQNTYIQIHF
jgi:hypothetical protein